MENKFLEKGILVSLKLMEEEDYPLIVKWRNLDRVRKNFIYREDFTIQGQYLWKETMIDTGKVVQLMICENDRGGRSVGSVYFRDIDMKEKCAEYGIFIGEDDALGRGYGNETAVLACRYAREKIGLKSLILRVFTRNTAAVKSYEHAGFVAFERAPDVECSDGQKDDMILMKISL